MTEAQVIADKKSAQKTRRETLKDLKRTDNTLREHNTLVEVLKLAHKQIMLAEFHLDLLSLKK